MTKIGHWPGQKRCRSIRYDWRMPRRGEPARKATIALESGLSEHRCSNVCMLVNEPLSASREAAFAAQPSASEYCKDWLLFRASIMAADRNCWASLITFRRSQAAA